jgi:tRNA G18 (ribose-2'-O)-methylase SpoU
VAELQLPRGCTLVGVELTEDAVELPSFHHPTAAAYVLGPERGSLSPALAARCDVLVKIPMKFCVNVGIAGAIVMYDRLISKGRFAQRPVGAQSEAEPLAVHVHGDPVIRAGDKD